MTPRSTNSPVAPLITGPLDADKQDYLLRDTYFCGVKYCIFDLQQLHRELTARIRPA